MDFITQVLAGLTVAALSALAGYAFRGRRYAKTIKEAPRRYVEHLDRLICEALDAGSNLARVKSQSIVSTRNDLRGSLSAIANRLNSDIDTLESQLQAQAPVQELFGTVQVLHDKWPAKKDQIEYEIRKLMAEIGLEKE